MKNVTVITVFTLSALLLALLSSPVLAATYTADGDLADWGLDEWYNGLNNGGESYWVPDSSTCYFVVEDNRDPDRTESEYFWPEYGSTPISGVHIKGTSSTYVDYDEPLINGDAQPAGAEICDIEAMYFDSDPSNVYFAIITSIPPENMGDLKITLESGETYGIVLPRLPETSGATTNLYLTGSGDWDKCGNIFNPWLYLCNPLDTSLDFRVKAGLTPAGTASVAYVNAGGSYKDNAHDYTGKLPVNFDGSNWVIEICVPRSSLGLNPAGGELDLHATLWCGNDLISIGPAYYSEIPEFTTIALPVCMILGMFYFFRRKRQAE